MFLEKTPRTFIATSFTCLSVHPSVGRGEKSYSLKTLKPEKELQELLNRSATSVVFTLTPVEDSNLERGMKQGTRNYRDDSEDSYVILSPDTQLLQSNCFLNTKNSRSLVNVTMGILNTYIH